MELLETLQTALIGSYRVERELGRGGMARVFLARDLRHQRLVAVKVLLPELEPFLGAERFLREIRIAASLSHPNIVPLFDSGTAGTLPFYVMPYLESESLRDQLDREKQLPLEDAVRIGIEVAEALAYAHRVGVVHRDIKPENLLLVDGHVQIADFGIARAVGDVGGSRLTSTGVTLGTPAYMSPEQVLGGPDVGARSDQYSLACVLYEMLAGQAPFTGATAEVIAGQHVATPPRHVTDLRPSVPPALRDALKCALAKLPADRFADMETFAREVKAGSVWTEDLQRLARETTRHFEDASTRPSRASRARRLFLLASGLLMLVTVALLAGSPMLRGCILGGPKVSTLARGEWILVPEFDGPIDDSQLATGVRELVCAALDQSGIVMSVPRTQLSHALRLAGLPDTAHVDAGLGRELAFRNAIRTVLEGRATRVGSGLAIVLRLVDSETGGVVLTESAVAPKEERLIPTVDRVVRRLRRRLGESRAAIIVNRALDEITTPSLDAYRLILAGDRLATEPLGRSDFGGAMAAYLEALTLDPDCADAFVRMADVYHGAALPDSAVWALDQALRRPFRLDDAKRLLLQAKRADALGDLPEALVFYDRCLSRRPSASLVADALYDREGILAVLGRDEEALRGLADVNERQTFSRGGLSILNFLVLVQAGQLHRADSVLSTFEEPDRSFYGSIRAVITGETAAAESLAIRLESAGHQLYRETAMLTHGIVSGSRGAFTAADDYLRRAYDLGTSDLQDLRFRIANPLQYRLYLALVGVVPVPGLPPGLARDSTAHSLMLRCLHAALGGSNADAIRLRGELSRCSEGARGRLGAAPFFLRAVIASREGRWEDVVDSLADIAREGRDVGYLRWNRICPTMERWLVADAYERLGRPDSAAAFFERAAGHVPHNDRTPAALTRSLARLRLVGLYSRMGRREEAEKNWNAVAAVFTHPDPEVRRRMDEALVVLRRSRTLP